MTFCFATWRKPTRKLRIANAGQTQPLLLRGDRVRTLKLVGFPFGIYDDVTYEEWSLILDPGNILVFHSDGLSEATDPEGSFFGIRRLAALLKPMPLFRPANLPIACSPRCRSSRTGRRSRRSHARGDEGP